MESYKKVASILGEERVFPLMFFLGIQPNTDLEQRLLEEGYLSAGYNPLMLTPTSIRKLLYNPAPLNTIHRQGLPPAWERKARQPGPASVDGISLPNPERITAICRQESDPRDRGEFRTGCALYFGRNPPVASTAPSLRKRIHAKSPLMTPMHR